jgi:3-carboxy-cis,cis-muconate cycloisomerase
MRRFAPDAVDARVYVSGLDSGREAELSPTMKISAFDHPLLGALLGDEEVAAFLSVDADLAAMLAFEAALAEAQAALGLIPAEAARRIAEACAGFAPDLQNLAAGVARDGVVAPALVAQLRAAVGEPHAKHLHRGATSQDVIDTSLTMRLKSVCDLFDRRLSSLIETLHELDRRDGAVPLMGRTRMQRALPITARDKLRAWREPLERHRARLIEMKPRLLVVQFGGPVGTRGDLDGKGDALAAELARRLGLGAGPCWQVERDGIGEFASWLSIVAGSLGKIGQDAALMAQNEVGEVRLAGGGGSSAMPHKSNPVLAETLVTLARFSAGLAGTLHQSLVAENERSGAAWTLEWLTLPPLVVATATSLRHAATMCRGLRFGAIKDVTKV